MDDHCKSCRSLIADDLIAVYDCSAVTRASLLCTWRMPELCAYVHVCCLVLLLHGAAVWSDAAAAWLQDWGLPSIHRILRDPLRLFMMAVMIIFGSVISIYCLICFLAAGALNLQCGLVKSSICMYMQRCGWHEPCMFPGYAAIAQLAELRSARADKHSPSMCHAAFAPLIATAALLSCALCMDHA